MQMIGRTIAGRYRIDGLLGQGGFGGVYRAKQLHIDRFVAVKLLHPHLEHRDIQVRRFEREAQLASRIRHPNAVQVFDFGQDRDDLYLVMEYLSGPTLKTYLQRRGALGPAETARIGMRIASALDAAHRIGLVHRDLKPANVIMTEVNGIVEPVVIDFGLAKLQEGGEGNTLTATDIIVGTPRYLSPEAVKGETVDQRADLYALGILLYELLTGAAPFSGPTPMATATRRLLDAPAPLSNAVGGAELPAELDALVMSLLSREPNDRPESGAAVAAWLKPLAETPEHPTAMLGREATVRLNRDDTPVIDRQAPPRAATSATTDHLLGDPADLTVAPSGRPAGHQRLSAPGSPNGGVVDSEAINERGDAQRGRRAALVSAAALVFAVVAALAWPRDNDREAVASQGTEVEASTAEAEATAPRVDSTEQDPVESTPPEELAAVSAMANGEARDATAESEAGSDVAAELQEVSEPESSADGDRQPGHVREQRNSLIAVDEVRPSEVSATETEDPDDESMVMAASTAVGDETESEEIEPSEQREDAVDTRTMTPEEMIARAERLDNAGRRDEATNLYREFLERYPSHDDAPGVRFMLNTVRGD